MGLVQLFRCHCKFNSNPSGTNIYERREHTVVEHTVVRGTGYVVPRTTLGVSGYSSFVYVYGIKRVYTCLPLEVWSTLYNLRSRYPFNFYIHSSRTQDTQTM